MNNKHSKTEQESNLHFNMEWRPIKSYLPQSFTHCPNDFNKILQMPYSILWFAWLRVINFAALKPSFPQKGLIDEKLV